MIEIDSRPFRALEQQVGALGKDMDWFYRELLKMLASQLEGDIIENTPVQTGELRQSWFITDVVKNGDTYEILICNNKEYASYVEYGHKQKPGRYVPAIGKRLTANWVDGKKMMTKSAAAFEAIIDEIIRKAVEEMFKKALGG